MLWFLTLPLLSNRTLLIWVVTQVFGIYFPTLVLSTSATSKTDTEINHVNPSCVQSLLAFSVHLRLPWGQGLGTLRLALSHSLGPSVLSPFCWLGTAVMRLGS